MLKTATMVMPHEPHIGNVRCYPVLRLHGTNCVLLLFAGKQDNLCPFASAVAAASKAPKGTLVSLDVGHFDPYVQPTLGQSLTKQLKFLKKNAV